MDFEQKKAAKKPANTAFNPVYIRNKAFSYYPPLARVARYVEQHLNEHISLKQAATVACLEEKYFSVYFHEKTGVCFSDWINYVRVNKAVQLLTQCDTPVAGIAEITGFNCLRTFERTFKKITGMTPMGFKKTIRTD